MTISDFSYTFQSNFTRIVLANNIVIRGNEEQHRFSIFQIKTHIVGQLQQSGETEMKYHPKSQARLTNTEIKALESYLRKHWADALSSPLIVTEGYEFHQTSDHTPGNESRWVLVVGRAGLWDSDNQTVGTFTP